MSAATDQSNKTRRAKRERRLVLVRQMLAEGLGRAEIAERYAETYPDAAGCRNKSTAGYRKLGRDMAMARAEIKRAAPRNDNPRDT